ncbi:ComEC/Rec2 family competence protein, partial [Candidatus Wolfebacteria bacterium]|nr:ComEC/Rec2 family competence protein [Candidatus Wolfebacteria bacterium]
MRIYDIVFYFIAFFLFGVLTASLKINFLTVIFIATTVGVLFLISGLKLKNPRLKILAILSLAAVLGAFYYNFYGFIQNKNALMVFNEKIDFNGIVADYPQTGDYQKFIIELQSPYSGKISAKLPLYPNFDYGDMIHFNGVIKKPFPVDYADYLAKDGIFGVSDFPKTEIIAANQSSKIKLSLFNLKRKIIIVFQKVLAPGKAAFLSGVTLGERAEFSKEFKEKMSKSGTTHLVALSGYNITIIGVVITAFLSRFLRRNVAFWLSILAIIGFTLMTGGEASVVRAAIMGVIALSAKQIGRVNNMRNAISIAAFLMVLFNPKVLRFDLGFQLSFAALLGIIYLSPAIKNFFKFKNEPGFLAWRENFLTTVSAQLAVIPLLLINFNGFSFSSFLSNILILEAIPPTMFLGFLIGFLGFIF